MKPLHALALSAAAAWLLAATSVQAQTSNYRTHLTGGQEVPPRDTQAQGQAVLQRKEGGALDFRLIVANIDNVRAAHIHCGAAGVNGPVGVTLFTGGGLGPVNGVLASGTITAPDATTACPWTTIDDVIAAIEAGNAYVNVHTNDGVDPPNTGPGDFPGGEIRGQLR